MSADIIILPMVPVSRLDRPNDTRLTVDLGVRNFGRLERSAREWNVTDAEAAVMLINEALDARGRR